MQQITKLDSISFRLPLQCENRGVKIILIMDTLLCSVRKCNSGTSVSVRAPWPARPVVHHEAML